MFSYPFQEQANVLFLAVIVKIYYAYAVQRVETKRISLNSPGVFHYARLVETPQPYRVTRSLRARLVQEPYDVSTTRVCFA